ncbi:MAG TPA: response regulator transcription factor [Gaiellaceae bacterium]|jgi:two-component system NarL family response regulator
MRHEASCGVRVVLADDDEAFLDALAPVIDSQPELSVVGAARDGVEAVECVERLAPDAVVIDLHMPRLDGVSAVAQLRREHPALCLIALTGDEDVQLHQAAVAAGADAVIVKDEFFVTLLARLASVGNGRWAESDESAA